MGHTFDMEIFKSGKWNGQEFKPADIAGIVASYDPATQKAPVTLDHDQYGPAFGWVEKIFKKGASIWATVGDIAPSLYAALKGKQYATRSVELYRPTEESPSFRLKAVSFLGAAIPAVKGMAPVELAETVDFAEGEFVTGAPMSRAMTFKDETEEEHPMPPTVEVKLNEAAVLEPFSALGKALGREFKSLTDVAACITDIVKENVDLKAKVAKNEADAADAAAKALVDKAIAGGHALEGQRDALTKIAKSDPETFADLYGENAPKIVPLGEVGSTAAGEKTSETKVDAKAEGERAIDLITGNGANNHKE